ncbi:MAG: lysozyme [Pseudomonadota bacterium]|nr:lysozyme [Pseudomonadota bacterium]
MGVGHTGPDVRPGLTITRERSQEILAADLLRFERAVNRMGGRMTQGQFDAMVSFAFNVGEGALKSSTLLKKHLADDYAGAARELARWNKAGGRVLPGLVKRRAAEAALYMS